MIAALRLFLTLLVPMLAVMLAGLFLVMRTGQADPWLWGGPALLFLALAGWVAGTRIGIASAIGAALCVVLLCWIASERLPLGDAALGLLGVGLLAALGGAMVRLVGRRVVGGLLLGCAALLLWWGARDRVPLADTARPSLAVLTALPLFWGEGGMARADAPIVTLLRRRFDVRAIDTVAQLRPGERLLLAQPRDPGASGLVAVDAWVRSGGQALLLVDPALLWPSRLPPGDRRRAPPITKIGPLLRHWGVILTPGEAEEARRFLHDGQLVAIAAAGRLRAKVPGCRAEDAGLVMRCTVGRGQVVLVADADLLDDRLWLADPARVSESRAWVADTPDLVVQWLGESMPAERRWLRDSAALAHALRWSLFAGMGWAAMGTALGLARKRAPASRSRPALPN